MNGHTALDYGMFISLFVSIISYNIYLIAFEADFQNVSDILIAAGGVYNIYATK
jgi:hypothetical protein